MSLSINNNYTANAAVSALRTSDTSLTQVSNQLATGLRIGSNPSIDASGLAIGTGLQTAAATLQTALTGANNAQSLLQLAAGGLSSVGNILQRMQSLATQANGATSTTQGFLNQEYQALMQQINQISTGTAYNTTQLLNGSLAGNVALTTNQALLSGAAGAVQTLYTASTTAPTDGQTITIGGQTITLTTNAANVGQAFVGTVPTQTLTGQGIVNFLNQSTNSVIDQFVYTNGAAGVVQAQYRGGAVTASNNAITIASANGTYASGTAATATIATGTNAGLTPLRVFATGSPADANFGNLQGSATIDQALVNAAAIQNNAAFVGNIVANNPVTATFNSANNIGLAINIGGYTYTANNATTSAAGTTVTFTGTNNAGTSGGSFTILQTGAITVTTQAGANAYAQEITNALSGITFMQNQSISSYTPGGDIITGGVRTGSLIATSFNFTSSSFASPNVSSVTVTAPPVGQTVPTISMVVNGQTFNSSSTLTSTIAAGTQVVLTNVSNPLQSISFENGATALNISTAANAASAQAALTTAFGLGNGAGTGLVVQVGNQSSQTINVTLASTSAATLGIAGTDLLNTPDSLAAATAISNAIATNSAQQAQVGAQESRFNYVISNLTASIQNTQAAAGNYLNTDVSTAAVAYASGQVAVQAAISVLTQDEQLPQNLLKLIV